MSRKQKDVMVVFGLVLAIAVFGCSIFVFAESDEASISTGEHFVLEPISQSIVPATDDDLVPPPELSFDESVFSEDLVFAVRRGDTMRKISQRALSVFLAEQRMTLEDSVQDSAEEILTDVRTGQSLRGKKSILFTHVEIADAVASAMSQSW